MFAYCRNNPVYRKDTTGATDVCTKDSTEDNPLDKKYDVYHSDSESGSSAVNSSGNVPTDARTVTSNPLSDIIYSAKVKIQMEWSDFHGFPKIVDNYGDLGSQTEVIGGDGQLYTRLEIGGSYRGYDGYFVYMWDATGICNHRTFEICK